MNRRKKTALLSAVLVLLCALFPALPQGEARADDAMVIDGKDGWYFFSGNSTLADYRGTNLYTEDQLDLIRERFSYMSDALEERGITFLILLAPNKEHIYSEYMPDSYGPCAAYTRIQQLYDCLAGSVRVLYPEAELKAAKERLSTDLYYRTDTHWNDVGAYLVSALLMGELGYEMPAVEEVTVTPYEIDSLDLSTMSGRTIPDVGYVVSGYETEAPCEYRVLIAGDSFGKVMEPLIRPVVSEITLVEWSDYDPALLDEMQPSVLVFEIVERFLDSFLLFSAL